MATMRVTVLSGVFVLLATAFASAQDTGDVGIVMGYPDDRKH